MAKAVTRGRSPILQISDLHVFYGRARALQGVTLQLDSGVLSVVGRNGMGKTTLCNAIMGLVPMARGRIAVQGRDISRLPPHQIVARGVAYVPQGRRVWPSLTVDEHLRVALRGRNHDWTLERVYELFPRLHERRRNGGAQLSGGEQQMLAIARALLANPRLLIMDEPTEGLAPILVEQVALTLRQLAEDEEISVLLIEQNLGVATDVSDRVAVMVNGRIARELSAAELAADHELQQRLLGVSSAAEQEPSEFGEITPDAEPPQMFQVIRRADASASSSAAATESGYSAAAAPTRWSQGNPLSTRTASLDDLSADDAQAQVSQIDEESPLPPLPAIPIAAVAGHAAYVTGTFDTKGRELNFIANCLRKQGLRVVTVDLSTSQRPSPADVSPAEVALHHPKGSHVVFTGDRGSAVGAMAQAFERFIAGRRDLGGIVSAGGSGGTALATPAMRALPVGTPKVMVSTVASGDVKDYVGPVDICMMYSVTDVAGINRISERILANAAHALAGMILYAPSGRERREEGKPAVGLTMFGVTTPCVQAVTKALEDRFDCLVFHATGTGGQSMEKLVDSGLLAGVLDITTTEVADLFMGGVFSAGEGRLDAVIRSRIPYVGSCGALDMVNWGPIDTVPVKYKNRNLYPHNPQVTLMRTTPEENTRMGRWIAEKLNRCDGPVRFLLPEGGVSLLDAPGKPFYDLDADKALFDAIAQAFCQTANRRLIRLPYNINEPPFVAALVEQFLDVMASHEGGSRERRYATTRF